MSAELDVAMAEATRDDGASWWARTEDGWYPSRILGFNLKSPTLAGAARVRPLHSHRHVHRRCDGATAAARRRRCRRAAQEGRRASKASPTCRGTRTARWAATREGAAASPSGISITGADSNATASSASSPDRAAPMCSRSTCARISTCHGSPLPTNTGDVTVHCSCTLHMSRPPIDRGATCLLHRVRPRAPSRRRAGGARPRGDPSAAPGAERPGAQHRA